MRHRKPLNLYYKHSFYIYYSFNDIQEDRITFIFIQNQICSQQFCLNKLTFDYLIEVESFIYESAISWCEDLTVV